MGLFFYRGGYVEPHSWWDDYALWTSVTWPWRRLQGWEFYLSIWIPLFTIRVWLMKMRYPASNGLSSLFTVKIEFGVHIPYIFRWHGKSRWRAPLNLVMVGRAGQLLFRSKIFSHRLRTGSLEGVDDTMSSGKTIALEMRPGRSGWHPWHQDRHQSHRVSSQGSKK
jgi:hypothetical protein